MCHFFETLHKVLSNEKERVKVVDVILLERNLLYREEPYVELNMELVILYIWGELGVENLILWKSWKYIMGHVIL